MADNQSTQTRPEFTWRFLSTSERYPNAKPLVIYVNASSEQEARNTMPGGKPHFRCPPSISCFSGDGGQSCVNQ